MKSFLWIVCFILAVFIALPMMVFAFFASSAPQQAGDAALAVAFAAVPYIIARAYDKRLLNASEDKPEQLKKCPLCAESVKKEALICRYCHNDFESDQSLNKILHLHKNT